MILDLHSLPQINIEPDKVIMFCAPENPIANLLAIIKAKDCGVRLLERNVTHTIGVLVGGSAINYDIRGLRSQLFDVVSLWDCGNRLANTMTAATLNDVMRLHQRDNHALEGLVDNIAEAIRLERAEYAELQYGVSLEHALNMAVGHLELANLRSMLWGTPNSPSPFITDDQIYPFGSNLVPNFVRLISATHTPYNQSSEANVSLTLLREHLDGITAEVRSSPLPLGSSGGPVVYSTPAGGSSSIHNTNWIRGIRALFSLQDILLLEKNDVLFSYLNGDGNTPPDFEKIGDNEDPLEYEKRIAALSSNANFSLLVSRSVNSWTFKAYQSLRVTAYLVKYYLKLFEGPFMNKVIPAFAELDIDHPEIQEAIAFFRDFPLGHLVETSLDMLVSQGYKGRRFSSTTMGDWLYPYSKAGYVMSPVMHNVLFHRQNILQSIHRLYVSLKDKVHFSPPRLTEVGKMLYSPSIGVSSELYNFSTSSINDVDIVNWVNRSKSYGDLASLWKRKPIHLFPIASSPERHVLGSFSNNLGNNYYSVAATGLPVTYYSPRLNHAYQQAALNAGSASVLGILDVFPVSKKTRSSLEIFGNKHAMFQSMMPAMYHLTEYEDGSINHFSSTANLINRLRLAGASPANLRALFPSSNIIIDANNTLRDELLVVSDELKLYYLNNFVNLTRYDQDVHVENWFNDNLFAFINDNVELGFVASPPTIPELRGLLTKLNIHYTHDSWCDKLFPTDIIMFMP
jgi:hypothetical protein